MYVRRQAAAFLVRGATTEHVTPRLNTSRHLRNLAGGANLQLGNAGLGSLERLF